MLLFVELRDELYPFSEMEEKSKRFFLDFILGGDKNGVSAYSKSSKRLI